MSWPKCQTITTSWATQSVWPLVQLDLSPYSSFTLNTFDSVIYLSWNGLGIDEHLPTLTMVTNALSGEHMGTYLGLFNGSICLPQIVASLASFGLFPLLGNAQPNMFLLAGIILALGAASVGFIKETYKA